ncbi:MAG: ribonuclease D [Neomegalonema sp.]|nr:ribonuclease D [Neomegalonema sp.]
MRIVRSQPDLDALCREFSAAPYITVDTEFVRERTFWPVLCLIQVARPDRDDPQSAAIIDPIDTGLDLTPFFELMAKPDVVKVFHAARQDIEIFHHLSGQIPAPLFDTQIAAMVCGFGDQVGYETLVRKVARASVDKTSRFTDWSRRPLTQKQLTYALGDVTHLRVIYETLAKELEQSKRTGWVAEEMQILSDPATYLTDPDEMWKKLKTRSNNGKFLSVARELAAWRERMAREKDIPRTRVLKDDALLEICASQPKTIEELGRCRLVFRESRKGEFADGILEAVRKGLEVPSADRPVAPEPKAPKNGAVALGDLLRVLLKAKAEEIGVAQRLLASAADLDALASDDEPDVPALRGWRREAFGALALKLKQGEIALSAGDGCVKVIDL